MDANELALLDAAIRNALTDEEDTAVALDTLGWRDALSSEPRAAVTVLFTALGDLNANASAVDDVMLHGFGVDTPHSGARSPCSRPCATDSPRPTSRSKRAMPRWSRHGTRPAS